MNLPFDKFIEKAFDSFKKLTPALVSLALISGMLLFLPESFLQKMKLNNLPDLWNRIIGIVFLLSVALIITITLFEIIEPLRHRRRKMYIKKALKERYNRLSPLQRGIIVKLLNSGDKTIVLDKNSGDTIYLESNYFIYHPEQLVSMDMDEKIWLTYVPMPILLEIYNEEPEFFK